jgi:hypothetical protein
MDPEQTAQMRGLVWIHAGHKRITLVLSWRGSIYLKFMLMVLSSFCLELYSLQMEILILLLFYDFLCFFITAQVY